MATRRPGLVAKKLVIAGKSNRHFTRTYWVKPDVQHALRLKRAKSLQQEAALPLVSPKASLQQWFTKRGSPLSSKHLAMLSTYFQKPNGTPFTGDDVEAWLGDPGALRVPLLERASNVKDPNTMEYPVRPVLDKEGQPLMQTVDLRWRVERVEMREGKVQITAHLMNYQNDPPNAVGKTLRTFKKEGGQVIAEHDLLKIDPIYGGGGIGSVILKKMMSAYPAMGVGKVQIGTAWIGRYTWASMGFQMSEIERSQNRRDFTIFAKQLVNGGAAHGDSLVYVERGTPPLLKPNKQPYTVDELLAVHNFQHPETWRAAAAKIPVYDPKTGAPGTRMLGKEFLLNANTEGWAGELTLQESNPNYQRLQSYLGINPPTQQAKALRQEANSVKEQAQIARDSQDHTQANALLEKAARIEMRAFQLESNAKTQEAIQKTRGQEYQRLADQEAAEKVRIRKQAAANVGVMLSLPTDARDELSPDGYTSLAQARLQHATQMLDNYGGKALTKEARAAFRAEQDMLQIEAKLALTDEGIRFHQGLGKAHEVQRLQAEREAIVIEQEIAQDKWLSAVAEAQLSGDMPTRSAPVAVVHKETIASSNVKHAQEELAAREKEVARLTQEGAPLATIQVAKSAQEQAYSTLGRIRSLAASEPFDAQEEEELAAKQKGILASRKLGQGLQALARVRKQEAAHSPFQTAGDRAILTKNNQAMRQMHEGAAKEVARLEALGLDPSAPALKAAKLQLMAAKNMLSLSDAALRRKPTDAEEARRMMTRQEALSRGEGLPSALQDLYRLHVAAAS